MIEGAR
jgi:hypothetical protein